MTTEAETVKNGIPEALADEDGERWCLQGHIDPALAVLAVVFEQMVNLGPQEAYDLLTGGATNYGDSGPRRTIHDQQADATGLVECVSHVWMRWDGDNDEYMLRCEQGDEGAEPWTLVDP